jgi:phospholipase C
MVDAIMRSPMWEDTALFLTWADDGGFFDHVPPAPGRRVRVRNPGADDRAQPVGPPSAVSHELGEFSSVLRFIEDNWSLRQLTRRDRRATPMPSAFDFSQPPRPPLPLPEREDRRGPVFPPP